MKIRRGGGGSVFLCSSFPNHGSKNRKEKENKKKTQKPITNNKLYDACNECTYSACFNVQILVQLFKIYQQLTWILTKNPKFWKTHFSKTNQIE